MEPDFDNLKSIDRLVSRRRSRWSAIRHIYFREMRDQIRDRRTLFTIAILPILLYPLLGSVMLQVAQFSREHPASICVIGRDHLGDVTPLFDGDHFADGLAEDEGAVELIHYDWGMIRSGEDAQSKATQWIDDGRFDLVLLVPPEFLDFSARKSQDEAKVRMFFDVTSDQSRVARDRAFVILNRWRNRWVRDDLVQTGLDESILNPFQLDEIDVAQQQSKAAAFWSKLLPFIMLVWAMTGAFYPAIDLVAGEKERGTLETLLCSPASRSEIVWGKLGAVATASMATAILNSGSMLITSSFIFSKISLGAGAAVGAPPILPMLWLLVALVPLSLLFSAVALAAAALARSSKEGQYYLMPLMMITLPLVLIPMLPGTELSAGTSLIPVTGMFLLVRSLVEGQFLFAALHVPMVLGVTSLCLWLAMNWARRQFEDEAVLFGSHEQFDLRKWVRRAWDGREKHASVPLAYFCGAMILVSLFFAKLSGGVMPTDANSFAVLLLKPQVFFILLPPFALALVFTRSFRDALRLRSVSWQHLALGLGLGIAFHPSYTLLGHLVSTLYPLSEQAIEAMKPVVDQINHLPWVTVLILIAVVPAFCEEIAFRGFIFGGLAPKQGHWRAVIATALLFGASHGVLQQSICATVMGVLLGWVAYRTGSVFPGILLHFANNAMTVSIQRFYSQSWRGADWFIESTADGVSYRPWWSVASVLIVMILIWLFQRLSVCGDESDLSPDDVAGERIERGIEEEYETPVNPAPTSTSG